MFFSFFLTAWYPSNGWRCNRKRKWNWISSRHRVEIIHTICTTWVIVTWDVIKNTLSRSLSKKETTWANLMIAISVSRTWKPWRREPVTINELSKLVELLSSNLICGKTQITKLPFPSCGLKWYQILICFSNKLVKTHCVFWYIWESEFWFYLIFKDLFVWPWTNYLL